MLSKVNIKGHPCRKNTDVTSRPTTRALFNTFMQLLHYTATSAHT